MSAPMKPALTIVPPVPVVTLAFHRGEPGHGRFSPEPLEVEIVAAAPEKQAGARLFIGGVKAAGAWLDRRGYRWVPGSNARWAA